MGQSFTRWPGLQVLHDLSPETHLSGEPVVSLGPLSHSLAFPTPAAFIAAASVGQNALALDG